MLDNEIVKVANAVLKNKVMLLSVVVTPFILIRFEYSVLQVVVLSLGSLFIFIALFMFYTNHKKSTHWISVVGRVVDVVWHDEVLNSGQTVKYGQEVIIYRTRSLQEHKVMNDISNTNPKKKGQKIKIFYNPEKGKEILVYDVFHMYTKYFFVILFGVIMIYYALQ